MQRIDGFLREEEVDDWACSLSAPVKEQHRHDSQCKIGFSDAVFRWPEAPSFHATVSSRFELGPLDVSFPPGALSVISGATASGKSALLAALLGGSSFLSEPCHCLNSRVSLRNELYPRRRPCRQGRS